MSLELRIENIAKSATVLDGNDPIELVKLQELFVDFVHEAVASELESAVAEASKCTEVLGQLVMREIDVEDALKEVFQRVEYVQKAVESYLKGEPVSAPVVSEDEDDSDANPIDKELLAEWLSSCFGLLSEVEAHSLEMERTDDAENLITEIRRHIHTLKGECGVLSLGVAQKLCHDSETLIESESDQGKPFPVDTILSLVDWFKQYATQLGDDPKSPPPDSSELEGRLIGGEQSAQAASAQVAPAEPGAETAAPESVPAPTEHSGLVDFNLQGEPDDNLNDFICESREHIAAAEAALLELEQDFTDSELINCVFRAFHTVKGVAGFLSLEPIVRLAHSAEFLLDEARKGDITLNSAYLNLILQSCDMLTVLLSALDDQDPPRCDQFESLLAALDDSLKNDPAQNSAASVTPGGNQRIRSLGIPTRIRWVTNLLFITFR